MPFGTVPNLQSEHAAGRSRSRRVLFPLLALTLSLMIAYVFGDQIVYWYDRRVTIARLVHRIQRLPEPHWWHSPWARRVFVETPHGLRLRPNLNERVVDPISWRETTIRTNALGYRGPDIRVKEPGEFRVLVLGDSFTLGAYCEEDETYPVRLEKALARTRPRLTVVNAGVAGISTREELIILSESGLLTQPDVVLVGMYLNDALSSRTIPIPEGLAAHSAIARQISELRLVSQINAESRAEYERLSGKPFPTKSFPDEAWRTDRAAFEVEIARAARDWGAAWFPWAWSEMRPDLEVMRELAGQYHFELVTALFPTTLQVEAEFLDDRPQHYF